MLKTRVITALLIATFGLLALFALPVTGFALVAAAVLLGIGGWEAARLAGLDSPVACHGFGAALLLIGLALGASLGLLPSLPLQIPTLPIVIPSLLGAIAGMWLLLFLWLAGPKWGGQPRSGMTLFKLLVLTLILLGAWLAISWLQARSPWLVLFLMLLIAAADVGAYFTGRSVGGPKLAPRISPGKTWSGVAGGLVATILVTALAAALLPDAPFRPMIAALVAAVLAWISVGGDLFISLLKRQRGLKDSSNLLPGHGGILDRFDSLGAALPFFVIAVAQLGS
ncbi:phosphatidate cytidylyltransferase [Wenzhouxiangella marina]|uniref:Phosphatidate cytidylyltransferase n=1 Tax=Wenzhouxiangella marina TaxID=1579979 RepID=A0A0K0XT04_9GAMM|nr:phosphatidate cytidylyltransferase [Wenzhouxiangella marina]AKS40818.1 phosphatidate cytidylyltransferase [Wenzhouxiangella marina]MBB6087692.1 phosphatidate cytidylyltransferase [Wenzhouxiangella marina]